MTKSRNDIVLASKASNSQEALNALLPTDPRSWSAPERQRIATLDERAARTVAKARAVGVDIDYLGVAELFDDTRIYAGEPTDWVLGPADDHETLIVPREQRRALTRLLEAGIEFPLTFVAHEVPKGNFPVPADWHGGPLANIDRQQGSALVGPPPAPAATVELGERLDGRSRSVFRALARAVPIVAGVAAAPFLAAGAVLGGLAATLDPIVLGAIPAVGTRPGDPAIWFALVKWDW